MLLVKAKNVTFAFLVRYVYCHAMMGPCLSAVFVVSVSCHQHGILCSLL